MKQPYEIALAARYLRSSNRNGFISLISMASIAGVGLAVAVLIIVLSVMNGFESELQRRILGVVSHASVSGIDGPLQDWEDLRERALGRSDERRGIGSLCLSADYRRSGTGLSRPGSTRGR